MKPGTSDAKTTRRIAADDSWFAGPPYAVPEEIFDEHSMAACSLSPGLGDEQACAYAIEQARLDTEKPRERQ
jgi:hypothetical protein